MKSNRGSHLWLLGAIILLSVSCSTGSGPGDEGQEDDASGAQDEYDAEGFWGQTFDFSMMGDLGQLADAVQDSMETEWTGTFTVDDNGIILGTGSADYSAAIFSEDDGCGYVWYETEDFDFILHGQVQQGDGNTTLSLVVELASELIPARTEPVATCGDPGTWRLSTPEIYFELHRDIMLTEIQLGLTRLSPRIEISRTLEAQTSGIDYTILVDLSAVPLTD